jgi:hypothetical protein
MGIAWDKNTLNQLSQLDTIAFAPALSVTQDNTQNLSRSEGIQSASSYAGGDHIIGQNARPVLYSGQSVV